MFALPEPRLSGTEYTDPAPPILEPGGGGPGPTLWNPGRGGPLKPPPPIVNGEPDHQYEDCEGMERKHAAKITTYNKNIKKNANIKKKKNNAS